MKEFIILISITCITVIVGYKLLIEEEQPKTTKHYNKHGMEMPPISWRMVPTLIEEQDNSF